MKKRNILFSVIVIAAIAAMAMALVPPPTANQNIGIYDTKVTNLVEQNCRSCHNSTYLGGVPTRHHNLVPTGEYACMNCHPSDGQSVLIERNCIQCHNGTSWMANATGINISRPHHINTAAAAARDCKSCHGSYISNYDDGHYVPTYDTSIITPTTHYKIYNETSGRYWGGCYACHQNSSATTPELLDQYGTHHNAINGNRSVNSTLYPEKSHQKDGTPGYTCNWCHASYWNTTTNSLRPIGYPNELNFIFRNNSWQTDPANLTGCEQCHDVGTIHNIQYNYSGTNGQAGYGHIGTNWDCYGCHAFWDAGASGFEGAMIPDLASVNPSVLKAGTATTLTLDGSNFLSGTGTYNAKVSIDGTNLLTPVSATDNRIIVNVPKLTAGAHTIQVVKTGDLSGDKVSKLSSLTVVSQVTITSAKLNSKSGVITISGKGFGTKPADNAQQYVTIAHAGQVFYSEGISSWSNTKIVAKASASIAALGDTLTVTTPTGSASVMIK